MPTEEQQIGKRGMPHNADAEQAVIGSMLLDKDAIMTAKEMLVANDFYSKQFGIIFDAIIELDETGSAADPVTLQNKLGEKGIPAEMSSQEYLNSLAASVFSSTQIEDYCKIVADKSLLRKMIKLNDEISNSCYDGKQSSSDILDDTEKRVYELVQRRRVADSMPISEAVKEAIIHIEAASRATGAVTGVPTGFRDLDYMLAGLQASNLVLIAARPSMGKTAFALNIAEYAAFREKKTVALFSLEMSEVELVNRLLSLESHVEATKIRTGSLNDDEWDNLIESAGIIGKSRLIIDAPPSLTVSELRSKCRKLSMENDLELIIIDYLQLMKGSQRAASESRQQEISEISRSLKSLAREINVPIVALSQLSRAVEQRPDKRPMLSDLRESGAIEQDADVVMFIYRDEYYNKDTQEKGVAEILIAKQRSGPVGTVKLAWIDSYTKFANLEKKFQTREEK